MKINKPRIFLSYSSKDAKFINRLYRDLKKFQVEPWRDTEEIRVGKSWLKVIFEDGLPTCDAVVVYLTKNSINSKMVQKEIDSALLQNLSDKGVAFLPFVDNKFLREELRIDLKTLQCPEWNNSNYSSIFPSVVSEIWQSYLEKVIRFVSLDDKKKISELELQIKKLEFDSNGSPFTLNELADFQFIYNELNKDITAEFICYSDSGEENILFKDIFSFSFLDITVLNISDDRSIYDIQQLNRFMNKYLVENYYTTFNWVEQHSIQSKCKINENYNFPFKFKIYNLIETIQVEEWQTASSFIDSPRNYLPHKEKVTKDMFNQKMYRFIYWLGYRGLLHEKIDVKLIKHERDYPWIA